MHTIPFLVFAPDDSKWTMEVTIRRVIQSLAREGKKLRLGDRVGPEGYVVRGLQMPISVSDQCVLLELRGEQSTASFYDCFPSGQKAASS